MRVLDRDEFNAQLGVLFGAFPGSFLSDERKEAYWRGLESMHLGDFVRTVTYAVGESGPDKLPSPKQVWALWREMRAGAAQRSRPSDPEMQQLAPEHVRFPNEALLGFMMRWPGSLPNAAVPLLVAEKNKLSKQMQILGAEDELTLDMAQRALNPRLEAVMREHAQKEAA